MTTSYTRYFRWGLPDFLNSPWHEDWYALVNSMDRSLYEALIAVGMTVWANSTVYAPGDLVQDSTDGSVWVCGVSHTSAVSPTTFEQDRIANPTYWDALVPLEEVETLLGAAQAAAAQATGAAGSAMMASQQASALLIQVQALVNANRGVIMMLAGEADRNARDARSALAQINAQNAAIAAYAMMAAQSAQRAAASAALLTDDQIALKAGFFN